MAEKYRGQDKERWRGVGGCRGWWGLCQGTGNGMTKKAIDYQVWVEGYGYR